MDAYDDGFDPRIDALQKRTRMLALLLLLSLGVGGGGAAYAAMARRSIESQLAATRGALQRSDAAPGDAAGGDPSEPGLVHPLGAFVVNLLDAGTLRYVHCNVEIEVEPGVPVEEVSAREAAIRDVVVSLLGSQHLADVLSSDGKSRLREEMLVRMNRLMARGQIARVYFTEFVVQ